MADPHSPEAILREQYADASNLNARARLHARFGTDEYGWRRWAFDRMDLADDARVLELGCGTGDLWLENRDRIPSGWTITLTDLSAGMLDEAREKLRAIGRRVTFGVLDAQAIPFGHETFDAVIANHMLYHIEDLDGALREVHRVLLPDGRFYAATNGADHMKELRALVGAVAPDLPFGSTRGSRDFGLEDGGALLEEYFSCLTLQRHETGLVITEPDPVVDYVLSVPGGPDALGGEARIRLRELVCNEIAARGAFRVTTSPGLFAARRDKEKRECVQEQRR